MKQPPPPLTFLIKNVNLIAAIGWHKRQIYLITYFFLLLSLDHKKIDEALQKAMLPGKFFILLDHKQDEHWKNLGLSLGIDHKDLTGIMTSCAAQHKNPAQELIHYLCAKDPNMPITEFKEFFDCTDTGIYRMDIIKKLDSQPGIYTIHMCHKVINTATLSQVRGQPMNLLCRRALGKGSHAASTEFWLYVWCGLIHSETLPANPARPTTCW